MHPQLQAQLNVRNNVREMHDYVNDLYAWESEIQAKDEAISKGKYSHSKGSPTPGVRGRAKAVTPTTKVSLYSPAPALAQGRHHKQSKRLRKKKPSAKDLPKSLESSAAGHTYDYFKDRWDKFDVDAALQEADEDTEYETESDTENESQQHGGAEHMKEVSTRTKVNEDGAPVRQQRDPQADADFWRTKGNEYFKFGDHVKAKECYGSSLRAVKTATAYANRALACIKLKEWDQAGVDCDKAIELDPSYLKAWQRRALVHKEQGNALAQLSALDQVLRLAPASKPAARELRVAVQEHAAARGLRLPSGLAPVPVQYFAASVPGSRPAGVQLNDCAVQRSACKAAATSAAGSGGSARAIEAAASVPHGSGALSRATAASADVALASAARPPLPLGGGNRDLGPGLPDVSARAVRAPSTSAEFEAAWRGFRGDLDRQADYLRALELVTLPRMFKSSLTPGVLHGILTTVLERFSAGSADEEWGLSTLECMTKVERFEMNVLLIPPKQREGLREAWATAFAGSCAAEERLQQLRAAYRLA